MIKHHFYRPLIKYLTEPNGDQTWGEAMSLCVKYLFDDQHCVNIANKYKDRFPHFHNCVLSNYGII